MFIMKISDGVGLGDLDEKDHEMIMERSREKFAEMNEVSTYCILLFLICLDCLFLRAQST